MSLTDSPPAGEDRGAVQTMPPGPPIVFFDGVCALCNAFVDAVLRADARAPIRVATLQGRTAREVLPVLDENDRDWTVVYVDDEAVHRESDAVLAVCRRLGGWWRLLGLARLVPRPWRDRLYRFIARRRYMWFGRREACRVPDERERERFLP